MLRTSVKSSSSRNTSLRLERLEERWVPAGDAVLRWNAVALDATKLDHAIGGPAHQFGPTRTSRALAIVHAAMYDAANSIAHAFTPYKFSVTAGPGASIDAAVDQAAHDTLVALYPSMQATFDAALVQDMSQIPTSSAQAGAAVGHSIATQFLALRANDGAVNTTPYIPPTGVGLWSADPTHPAQQALTPYWGSVTPFVMQSGSQFRAAPPPALNSPEYTAAYNELLLYGGNGTTTPTIRTTDETEIGIYWGYDGQPGLCSPPRLYNQIAVQIAQQQHNTMLQNARYLCLVNLALGDAGIAVWETKFHYNFWRPITAIRAGDQDGNSDTPGIANWTPYGAPADNGGGSNFTPPFPAYTSGHAGFGAAAFRMIADFYGTDKIPFTFVSDEFNGLTFDMNGEIRPVRPRHFDTLSQAAEENGQSRIYLGIHWAFDKNSGIAQGDQIADYIFKSALRAKPNGQRFAVGADFGGGPHVRVQDGTTGQFVSDFFAYDASFRGGVRVAMGDVNGDGVQDIITAAGPTGGPHVKVFDGTDLHVLASFMAYDLSFTGGVFVAAGDVDGDGKADIITSPDFGGGPHVKAFSGADGSLLLNFFAYDQAFRGGVHVAAGDVNGDGHADIITGAGLGGGPHVRAFSGADATVLTNLFAYDPSFIGGVYVAAGDCDGDGRADIVTGAGAGGGPHVKVFNYLGTELQSYMAILGLVAQNNGIHVGCADFNGDGRADILASAAPGSRPLVSVRDAVTLTELERPAVFDPSFLGGVFVGGPA